MRRNVKRTPSGLAVGALVIVLVVVATFLAFTKDIPFTGSYQLRAAFRSANNIRLNSPVRIAGIEVGKVTGIERQEPGEASAVVTMQIDDSGLPIHRDARLKIRPRIFLEGNFFVDLQPGTPSAPTLDDGGTIPINQTATPVQLDQLLIALQSDTREDLTRTLAGLSQGLYGPGARGYRRSIPFWEPAYRDSAIVNDATLGQADRDLSGYVAKAGVVAQALDRNGGQLKSLITDFNTTAHAFAIRDLQLSDAIVQLPRLLRVGRPALSSLDESLPPVRRLVADLRPGVRSSEPAIDAGLPFVRQLAGLVRPSELRGLSRDLRPTVPSLARLNERTVPLLGQTRAAASCQNEVVLPWSRDRITDTAFPSIGPVFQEQTRFLPGLAGESRSGDANGQWFRVLAGVGNFAYPDLQGRFMLATGPLLGVNPPAPLGGKRPPLRPDVPCETQEQPDLASDPAPAPKGLRVNTTSPRAQDLLAKAKVQAVKWLHQRVRVEGLADELPQLAKPIKAAEAAKR